MSGSARLLTVGVADLLRRPGSRRAVTASVPSGGIVVADVEVATGATIHAELVLEALSDGVVATGRVCAPWRGPCRRCLTPVDGWVDTQVREVFERHPTEGETWPLQGDHVDLVPVVRDAVALALPLAPLCGPDCAGPDPGRFPAHSGEPTASSDEAPAEVDGHGGETVDAPRDPRWAKLDELRFDR